ncbi:MAG: hypothetical protein IJO57_05050 [Bacilli bacterium]|nr:hypothetical protein [Bacilli bacterium]
MKMKNSLCLIGLGVGGTLLYQQAKNGNLKKMFMKMKNKEAEMIKDMMEELLDE